MFHTHTYILQGENKTGDRLCIVKMVGVTALNLQILKVKECFEHLSTSIFSEIFRF